MIIEAIQTDAVQDTSYKEFKQFINSLRCPLCNSQLDGNVHPKEARIYCVLDNSEYKATWHPNELAPEFELIHYSYPQYGYEIIIRKLGEDFRTTICRFNMDVVKMYRESTKEIMLDYIGDRLLFFRSRMEESLFLKKLKTYLIFS